MTKYEQLYQFALRNCELKNPNLISENRLNFNLMRAHSQTIFSPGQNLYSWLRQRLCHSDYSVYSELLQAANADNKYLVIRTIKYFVSRGICTRRTLIRSLKRLEANGYLHKIFVGSDPNGDSTMCTYNGYLLIMPWELIDLMLQKLEHHSVVNNIKLLLPNAHDRTMSQQIDPCSKTEPPTANAANTVHPHKGARDAPLCNSTDIPNNDLHRDYVNTDDTVHLHKGATLAPLCNNTGLSHKSYVKNTLDKNTTVPFWHPSTNNQIKYNNKYINNSEISISENPSGLNSGENSQCNAHSVQSTEQKPQHEQKPMAHNTQFKSKLGQLSAELNAVAAGEEAQEGGLLANPGLEPERLLAQRPRGDKPDASKRWEHRTGPARILSARAQAECDSEIGQLLANPAHSTECTAQIENRRRQIVLEKLKKQLYDQRHGLN
jgi:hypothetical protein